MFSYTNFKSYHLKNFEKIITKFFLFGSIKIYFVKEFDDSGGTVK